MRRSLLVAFALCCAPTAGAAEFAPPTNVDLKAAYCAGRLRDLPLMAPTIFPEESRARVDGFNAKIEAARTRLKAYILPRLRYIDGEGLIAATQAGVADQAAYVTAMKACTPLISGVTPEARRSFTDCYNGAGWAKLQECETLDFLPF